MTFPHARALLSGLVFFCALSLHGDELSDAQALLKQGDFNGVQETLAPLLDQVDPPVEALALSYRAARTAGQVYTAERRVRALIEREGERNPDWIYEGAMLARDLGDEARSLDRLMFYVRTQKEKSPRLEQALQELNSRGNQPKAFQVYHKLYGSEKATFSLGRSMLERLKASNEPAAMVEMAGILVQTFNDPAQINRVYSIMRESLEQNMYGLNRDAVYKALLSGNIGGLGELRRMVERKGMNAGDILAFMEKSTEPLDGWWLYRIKDIGNEKNETLRKGYAQRLLALEPLYRQKADGPLYRSYAWRVIGNPRLYFTKNDRWITEKQADAIFRQTAAKVGKENLSGLRSLGDALLRENRDTPHRFVKDAGARRKLLQELSPAFSSGSLMELTKGNEKNPKTLQALFKATGNRLDVRMRALEQMRDAKMNPQVIATTREELLSRPTNFDERMIARGFLSAEGISSADKVKVLEEAYQKTGNADRLKKLINNRDNRKKNDAALKAFASKLDSNKKAQDPVLAILMDVAANGKLRGGKEPSAAFNQKMNEAFAAYGKSYPDASAPALRNAYMQRLLQLYRDTADNSREGRRAYAKVVAPKLSAKANWEGIIDFSISDNGNDGLSAFYVANSYVPLFKRYRPEFATATHPIGSDQALLQPYFAQMSGDALEDYLYYNRNQMKPAFLAAQVKDALKNPKLAEEAGYNFSEVLMALKKDAKNNSALPLAELRQAFLAPGKDGSYNGYWRIRNEVIFLHKEAGQHVKALEYVEANASKAKKPAAVHMLLSSLYADRSPPAEAKGSDTKPGHARHVIIDSTLPLISDLDNAGLSQLYISNDMVRGVNWMLDRNNSTPEQKKSLEQFEIETARALAAGAGHNTSWREVGGSVLRAFRKEVADNNIPGMQDQILLAGRMASNDFSESYAKAMIDPLVEGEHLELLLLLTSVVNKGDPAARMALNQARGLASSEVTGIYPVEKTDPAYPLFQAADELARNNRERAWTLLRENLEAFAKDPLMFPPEFTAWSLNRLREVRGEGDVWLNQSRELSNAIMTRSGELTPNLQAAVMLNRAELFRDEKNFEAARLEYQAIRQNPELQKTPAGRQAMFRDVDLMISMGNESSAENLIEYWLATPDPELQIKAHYFQALMAFNAGDDEATRENLDKVFALDFTNAEARLLHGKWRLRTNYEVDNPEVLLGTLRDRTILRPGQPLRISVKDENLSVVGGGSAIPVLVKTSQGGDLEKLNLFPSTRDPKLFRGSIDTQLGAAVLTNSLLEVNGMDVVSYEIEPEFLANRGMTTSEPKQLRIVDDARLAVSPGNILTEAEQQELEIEQQMNASTGNSGGGNIRPGNPFYILVRDRDRSNGADNNEIQVSVETSSGDRLSRLTLTETAPYTGEFRGSVPTALPPPRASASDTAEGMNPGDVININNSGTWRSKADGKPGKWLKADTMGSHLVQRAQANMPDPKGVKEIVLHGALFGEEMVLGSFPKRSIPGGGIRLQTSSANLRSIDQYREHFGSTKTTPKVVDGFKYDVKENGRQIHLRGAFWKQDDKDLSLRFLPLMEGQKYAMNDAFLTLLVNGEKVASGRGSELAQKSLGVSLPAGGHILEVFGYVKQKRDGFELAVEYADGSVEPLPAAWFSTQENPELESFLQDKATLSRNENGWVADFKEPMRLRSLRWEFVRYTGDSVSVSELRIQDSKGKPVLPSANDFSMALNNEQLEVAPGDRITVTYLDTVTSDGARRPLSQRLGSSFNNGNIGFFFETLSATSKGMSRSLNNAFRFRPGDDFLVVVNDSDLDVSPEADTVEIRIRSRGGQNLILKAVETGGAVDKEGDPVHSGRFEALLRTTADGETGSDTLRVGKGDRIEASYTDTENTSPGIPFDRLTSLESVQPTNPIFTFYHTWRERMVDDSVEAEGKLNQIRGRSGNQSISELYTWTQAGRTMTEEEMQVDPLLINTDAPMPLQVYMPSEAMHSGSHLILTAIATSEKEAAAAEGREAVMFEQKMGLGRGGGGVRIERAEEAEEGAILEENATFAGSVPLALGTATGLESAGDGGNRALRVQGNDQVELKIATVDGKVLAERNVQLVSEAVIDLMDSGFEAGRRKIHLGERFFVVVYDSDQDKSSELDEVTIKAVGSRSGNEVDLVLKETLPHSGVFTGVLLPRFESSLVEEKPADAEMGEDAEVVEQEPDELAGIPSLGVVFGESIEFRYEDLEVPPVRQAGTRSVTGELFEGSDGNLLAFTKYFPEEDMAVRVQFRLAESLFEMAKDYRKLKQQDKSSESIAEGKRILEEALASHPDSELAVEGEYLLANLYQEMAAEVAKEDEDQSKRHYQEALARFSSLLSSWPDSDFAARAQYHKALCLEKLGDFRQASEEYVKMTYIFPESPLVGDAAIRLATHYYKNEERFDTAGKIYANFHSRFSTHPLAAKALFMSAQCHLKQGDVWEQERIAEGISGDQVRTERILDEYRSAVKALETLINDPAASADKEIRAQAMYWAGDASLRAMDYPNAYLFLKRVTFEYPESEWARRARGLLLQSAEFFEGL